MTLMANEAGHNILDLKRSDSNLRPYYVDKLHKNSKLIPALVPLGLYGLDIALAGLGIVENGLNGEWGWSRNPWFEKTILLGGIVGSWKLIGANSLCLGTNTGGNTETNVN